MLARERAIAVYAPGMDVRFRDMDAVSGHIQVPLVTLNQLVADGFRTTLITTRERVGRCHPQALPSDVDIIRLTDASPVWPSTKTNLPRAIRQLAELLRELNGSSWDLVHFFGQHKTFLLSAMVSRLTRCRVAVTVMAPPPAALRQLLESPAGFLLRHQIRGLSAILVTTEWLGEVWRDLLPDARIHVARPGITKPVSSVWQARQQRRTGKPNVLFWRNANRSNGADVCVEVYERLLGTDPDAQFHFAVRPDDELEQQLLSFARQTPRVHVHRFPYAEGPTLRELLSEATCCFFPFRRLSINPQMAVLETLYAGCPIVASDVESLPEMLGPSASLSCGSVDDISGHAERISALLRDPATAHDRGIAGGKAVRERWNWKSYEQTRVVVYEELFRDC